MPLQSHNSLKTILVHQKLLLIFIPQSSSQHHPWPPASQVHFPLSLFLSFISQCPIFFTLHSRTILSPCCLPIFTYFASATATAWARMRRRSCGCFQLRGSGTHWDAAPSSRCLSLLPSRPLANAWVFLSYRNISVLVYVLNFGHVKNCSTS